jgi:hypothetical protein
VQGPSPSVQSINRQLENISSRLKDGRPVVISYSGEKQAQPGYGGVKIDQRTVVRGPQVLDSRHGLQQTPPYAYSAVSQQAQGGQGQAQIHQHAHMQQSQRQHEQFQMPEPVLQVIPHINARPQVIPHINIQHNNP